MDKLTTTNNQLLEEIKQLLISSRQQLSQTINTTMVQTYWQIGKMIVEDEQDGNTRAKYGQQQLQSISKNLTQEFGRGFEVRNLRNMRQFYIIFQNWHSVSAKLSWTHYKKLISIENETARLWYMNEAIQNRWSTRALERQVSKLYYERLLSSKEKTDVINAKRPIYI